MITLLESKSDGYRERTSENAKSADLTLAFAYDFQTAGEKLTKSCAGKKYLAIDKDQTAKMASSLILGKVLDLSMQSSFNVAGNGIYTLSKYGITQSIVNNYLFTIFTNIKEIIDIKFIRSGGQTGLDTAGLVAGIKLGIPVIGLYPKGFRRRNEKGIDFISDSESIKMELIDMVNKCHLNHG